MWLVELKVGEKGGSAADAETPDGAFGTMGNERDETLAKIRKQIEFYFSDSNLPKDKYLKGLVDSNEHGYVPIETLLKFKRMSALTTELQDVVDAVADSELVGVDPETSTQVRRTQDLPKVSLWRKRTALVSGFPACTSADDPEPDIDAISELFEPYGDVLSARRSRRAVRDQNGTGGTGSKAPFLFDGTVHVEMKSEEALSRVLAEDEFEFQMGRKTSKLTVKALSDVVETSKKARKEKKQETKHDDKKKKQHEAKEKKHETRAKRQEEAAKQQQINEAQGEAAAILAVATATADGLRQVASALTTEGGEEAMQLKVAQQYIDEFGNLAREGNTLVVPANLADLSSMIALATNIAKGETAAPRQGI